MDRLNQLRGEAGDSTLDTSSPPSEAFMSANESSSKYFSLSEVDSTFSISPSKDAAGGTADSERAITEDTDIISNLSPIPKADNDTFKIGKHIEAANILSGGVNIFDDNENSYDGDELVIDDNVVLEDEKVELKLTEDAAAPLGKDVTDDTLVEGLDEADAIPSKDTEVVLQIDGKNVDAIDIGNGLYLYRKSGEKELSAVQIIDDDQQQPSFKFLKVRENAEGNLEVYEEIQIEIPKEVPPKDGSSNVKTTHVPIKDINKVNEPSCNKVIEKINRAPKLESNLTSILPSEPLDTQTEPKSEVNINGKMMKFNESRKSPLTFTPMAYHSTPNKEGIPLTKTMVDQQLHPSRHSDNIKKTIEVHTDNSKPKTSEASYKTKELNETNKTSEISIVETEGQTTIVEKEVKTVPIEINEILSDKIQEQNVECSKESSEIKSLSENTKSAGKTLEVTKIIAEDKVREITQDTDNFKCEEIKNTKEDETITSQNLTVSSELKESIQNPKGLEDNQNMTKQAPVKENVNNKSPCKDSEVNKIETEKNNDNTGAKPINNMTDTNKTIEIKELALSHEIINYEKVKSQSNKKDHVQLSDPNIEQGYTEDLKLSSSSKIKINTEIAEEKSVQELSNDNVVGKSAQSNSTVDINTNDIADEKIKSDKIIGSEKNKTNDNDISLKINKVVNNESDNVEIKSNRNEHFSNINDLQVPEKPKSIIESQTGNFICNKDMRQKVQDGPIESNAKRNAVSLAPTKSDNIESQKISKAVVESSKVLIKDTNKAPSILPKHIQQVDIRKEVQKIKVIAKPNTCNSAVPFGKWTEANRQEFLNKIKETKIPSNNSNTNQIKQTNDLNRRDVLKKFDSQRQSTASVPTKILDFGSVPKFSGKMETAAFVNKSAAIQQPNPIKPVIAPMKAQAAPVKAKTAAAVEIKKAIKEDPKNSEEQIINSQELINKTVEGIITRALKMKTTTPIHMKQKMTIHTVENPKDAMPLPGSLDYIEMKMNELHGFSFTDKPAQELSQAANHNIKPYHKFEDINIDQTNKIPNLLPFKATEQQKALKEPARDDTSDEEIIEHEPITGDIDVSKQNLISLLSCKEKFTEPKKEPIITETDFDKFAGKNSITYEKCLTVNFDGKEKHNVVQTVVEKETTVKKLSRNELLLAESKAKSSSKQNIAARHNNQASKIPTLKSTSEDDGHNKNYQSKVQIAYQSALTAKRNLECPISMIEDKPVKVVYMDTNAEYTPTQFSVQGQELSPSKNHKADNEAHSASESLDSDILESTQDLKPVDEKSKSKHQRKQVLTPVEHEPEIELIEPSDLGIKVSPKKRKIEEKSDKHTKNLVPKKSYLLNRNVTDEHKSKSDQPKTEAFTGHNISTPLDSLVKAAELIENQSESKNVANQTTETPQTTPVKRGRGRPRKYPLPELGCGTKPPSPQKKPRLIDAKPEKTYTDSDESSDGEVVKENWTMGKINENIVCPICSKLFRSEDVLFKHVKHCTGPSPNRSESDKRSPRRLRNSQESERKLLDSRSDTGDNDTEEENDNEDESVKICNKALKPSIDMEDVIVIEDTPIKQKHTEDKTIHPETKKIARQSKHPHNTNLVCEICGKTFRQLSYLVNHKMQHKNEDLKNTQKLASDSTNKSVFSCEVCRKEFRKLHHLVQHRIIHNTSSMASKSLRKTSSEALENKHSKPQSDDTSAGFRCEPCDKSFRKLHHLVEHRETHDGINKKGNTSTSQATDDASKSVLAHHCDICKKVFKKLQDLLEHKEQHYETSSEKSDDKSVISSLSTKDIIHECSLCYMVFPNEHSLTKHTVICLRKKKQSAAKQAAKQAEIKEGKESPDEDNIKSDEDMSQDIPTKEDIHVTEDSEALEETTATNETKEISPEEQQLKDAADESVKQQFDDTVHNLDIKPSTDAMPKKRHSNATNEKTKTDDVETPVKIKKVEVKERSVKIVELPMPRKKAIKDKALTVTKKHKIVNSPVPVIDNEYVIKPTESSDDDEIRYMLNPNFKEYQNIESKMFMKIRALKRNSLQIERPNSKDLVKRRISLQHPPKMPRLKAKPVESKPTNDQERSKVMAEKKLSSVAELTTDSDDSDVKYSFPEQENKNVERKVKRQSPAVKRKSLVGIAKRKSLGKTILPIVKPKKRISEAEHRCDCGKLFSSAALLSRHTTLDHTPPRIRRRRSPPPDTHTKPNHTKLTHTKPTNTKPINKKPKTDVTNSNKTLGVATRKSSVSHERKQSINSKSVKSDSFKSLRSAKSVPVTKKLEKKK